MSTSTIPIWNAEGVLPPIDLSDPTSDIRSPYTTSLTDFVLRFAISAERIAIINGLLNFRQKLHAIGLESGFQWVNGSFLENVELLQGRAPRDVDLVTLYELPSGETQASILARNPALFDHDHVKANYLVDSYYVDLSTPAGELVQRSAYWYGVWSHQRHTFAWKGFAQIDLAPHTDADSRAILASTPMPEGSP